MPIISRLDRVMAERKISVNELSRLIEISPVNISRMRRGHIKAVRFSTMERICDVLDCQPGDLFEYIAEEDVTMPIAYTPKARSKKPKKAEEGGAELKAEAATN
ncbi:helix-turn-helix transcriptional regulator [uncultured Adlercreutzia sp.]|uniref:helix-turn-helix domain-containing protein n=1 Tax=uncultured Adlercreutzia sp. TaxID=875803 RepID=UPI0025FB88BC|nr:helix-turn-helix transcriptional regulator [uncultured Adlercreutzia sp.]